MTSRAPRASRDVELELGRDELARGAYFEAHERWEQAWHLSAPPDRAAVQALVQLAAALLHLTNGNRRGAESVLHKARRKLSVPGTPSAVGGIDVTRAATAIGWLLDELAAGRMPDPRSITV